jgi:hypothetical protein
VVPIASAGVAEALGMSRRRAFKALRQPKPPKARGNRRSSPPPGKVGALAKRVFDRTPNLIVEKA